MARRYSLEPLVGARRRDVERRTGELGQATVGRQKEQAGVEVAKARTADARRSAKATRDAERGKLERGSLTARDLVQGELYRAGVASQLSALARGEAAAVEKLARAKTSEAKAKVALGRARSEEDAVLRHRGRFHAELSRKQEKEHEEAAAEVFTAARRGARRA